MTDEEIEKELRIIRHNIVVIICDDGNNSDWNLIIQMAEKARNLQEE